MISGDIMDWIPKPNPES